MADNTFGEGAGVRSGEHMKEENEYLVQLSNTLSLISTTMQNDLGVPIICVAITREGMVLSDRLGTQSIRELVLAGLARAWGLEALVTDRLRDMTEDSSFVKGRPTSEETN